MSKIKVPAMQKHKSKAGKKKWPVVLIVLVFAVGFGILLYPTFSDWYNSFHQSKAVETYSDEVSAIDEERYAELLESARAYNEWLYETNHGLGLSESELADYETQLQVSASGMIGSIRIDKIDVNLPVYLGTSEGVLSSGVGHLEGSSLPVGGENTHCVLSAHSGLVSATLFTNLNQLDIGDTFVINVLNETLTYEVDQILVVEPDDTSALQIVEGEDYCTLLTCTPYGINSHRLLVRGTRVANAADGLADASCIPCIPIFSILAAAIAVLLFALLRRKRKKKQSALRADAEPQPAEGLRADTELQPAEGLRADTELQSAEGLREDTAFQSEGASQSAGEPRLEDGLQAEGKLCTESELQSAGEPHTEKPRSGDDPA